jgi:hypothetical protein
VRPPDAQKNGLKPWLKKQWVIPPEADADFVCALEDVLEVYHRDFDPARPVLCLDEASKQLVAETRRPIPAAPGQPARVDYEYEPGYGQLVPGHRAVDRAAAGQGDRRRTAVDFAEFVRDIVDKWYPEAEKIVLVMDNLNTHKPASLYEAFEPAEARRLVEKLEIHYTPKHGSWLNIGWWVSGVARQRKFLTPSKLRERRTFAASVTTPYASMSSASRAMALTHHPTLRRSSSAC